jgi:hypothetical protein
MNSLLINQQRYKFSHKTIIAIISDKSIIQIKIVSDVKSTIAHQAINILASWFYSGSTNNQPKKNLLELQ